MTYSESIHYDAYYTHINPEYIARDTIALAKKYDLEFQEALAIVALCMKQINTEDTNQ